MTVNKPPLTRADTETIGLVVHHLLRGEDDAGIYLPMHSIPDAQIILTAAQKIIGIWNGALVTPGPTLRLRVTITKTAAGAATGTMVSLDQGTSEIPVSAITLKEGKVRFEVPGVGGLYEGTLASDGTTLSGQWQQQGNTLPLDLQKTKTE